MFQSVHIYFICGLGPSKISRQLVLCPSIIPVYLHFPRKRMFSSVDALQVINGQQLRLCSEISSQEPKRT